MKRSRKLRTIARFARIASIALVVALTPSVASAASTNHSERLVERTFSISSWLSGAQELFEGFLSLFDFDSTTPPPAVPVSNAGAPPPMSNSGVTIDPDGRPING